MYLYLLSYFLLGAGLKYIDDAFDKKTFSKKIAIAAAPLLGILWVYMMALSEHSATILFAILLGVAFRGKIDNLAHLFGLLVIVVIIFTINIEIMLLPLIFLSAAAFIDELGNDIVDYQTDEGKMSPSRKLIDYFFKQRWFTKIGVIYLIALGLFPHYFFFALLLFDIAYLSVGKYGLDRKAKASGA